MISIFRQQSVFSFFFLLILALVVHVSFFFHAPSIMSSEKDGLISWALALYLQKVPATVLTCIYLLLILSQAIHLNLALNNQKLYQQQGFTTAMAYVVFTGFFVQWSNISAALFSNSLIILIYTQLSKLYNHPSPKALIFNTGIITGISILLYHPASILIGITIFALAIVRPFRIAEWFILLMGIIVPFYFLTAYLYLTDHMYVLKNNLPSIQLHVPIIKATNSFWIGVGLLLCLLFIGLASYSQTSSRMLLQLRKNWGVMIVLLILTLPQPFIYKNTAIEAAIISLVPIATFTGCFFLYPRKLFFPNLLLWMALGLALFNNWQLLKIK